MHKYIDPSFLPFITYTLNNKIKNIVLKQVALIGLNNLKIKKTFISTIMLFTEYIIHIHMLKNLF